MSAEFAQFGIQEIVGAEAEHDCSGLCTAEVAECTCPDFCERDHETD